MKTSFQQLIDDNAIDAIDYMERIIDFIDEKYKTTYNNCDMNDDIEQLSDKIKNKHDFETVESLYKSACEKYSLVKENKFLNPKFRLINSWYVFNKPFDELLDYLDHNYEDERFDEKYNEIMKTLIRLFPKCEKTIELQMRLEDIPDSNDEVWLMPRNEIDNEEYKKLYSYIQNIKTIASSAHR